MASIALGYAEMAWSASCMAAGTAPGPTLCPYGWVLDVFTCEGPDSLAAFPGWRGVHGTGQTVEARFWPWLSGQSPVNLSSCSIFARIHGVCLQALPLGAAGEETASERRWNNLKGRKDFYLEAKASTVPHLPYSLDSGYPLLFVLPRLAVERGEGWVRRPRIPSRLWLLHS